MENHIPKIAHYRSLDGEPQSVRSHLYGTADVAKVCSGKIGVGMIGELVGLVHDLGKYSDTFFCYIRSACGLLKPGELGYLDPQEWRGQIDHSTAGAQWIWRNMPVQEICQRFVRELLSLCISSHHGGLIECLGINGEDCLKKRMMKDDNVSYYDEVARRADAEVLERALELVRSPDLMIEIELLLKRIKAGPETGMLRMFWTGLAIRFVLSGLIDADRLDTCNFESPVDKRLRLSGKYISWERLVACFERHIAGFNVDSDVNRKRMNISRACLGFAAQEQGLCYLTVPTGGGKTLASMRFALHHAKKHQLDRIVYVIPYTSIIEQNAQEIRSVFDEDGTLNVDEIVLEHHSNLHEKHDTKRNRLLSENWDAPIVFTTSVQVLESLFDGGTRSVRRMHQLSRSVIIFDEVQTLPINTVHIFNNAVNFLTSICSSTVVFCTATQPLLHGVNPEKGAVPYSPQREIVPDRSLFRGFRRISVYDRRKPGAWALGDLRAEIEKQVTEMHSVLVIANTKRDAKRIFDIGDGVAKNRYHLSTAMCPAHRLDVLRRVRICLKLKIPVLCVSTQLIEAGVNLDFGCVIRALAGLDSIAQAAGRCNRNNRRATGRVMIVNIAGEDLANLPTIRRARDEACRVLDEYADAPGTFAHDPISPEAIDRFYEYYFYQRAAEMDYRVRASELGRDDTLLSLLSDNRLSVFEAKRTRSLEPERILRQAFDSAGKCFKVIDAPTQGILVPYEGSGKKAGEAQELIGRLAAASDVEEERNLLKRAQRYSVNIFPRVRKALDDKGALYETSNGSDVWVLRDQFYSADFGVSTEAISKLEFLCH